MNQPIEPPRFRPTNVERFLPVILRIVENKFPLRCGELREVGLSPETFAARLSDAMRAIVLEKYPVAPEIRAKLLVIRKAIRLVPDAYGVTIELRRQIKQATIEQSQYVQAQDFSIVGEVGLAEAHAVALLLSKRLLPLPCKLFGVDDTLLAALTSAYDVVAQKREIDGSVVLF